MTKFFAKHTGSGAITEIDATAPFDAAAHLATGTYRIAVASDFAPDDLVVPTAAEAGAVGHWLLGSDNPGHAGLVGGDLSVVTAAPGLAAGHATMAAGVNTGLESAITETADMTLAGVFRIATGNTNMLMGRFNPANPKHAVFHNGEIRSNHVTGAGSGQMLTSGVAGGGVWTFVAVTLAAGGARRLYVRKAGGATVVTDSVTRQADAGARQALGPAASTVTNFDDPFDVAEFVIWDSALSQVALDGVYARAAARLADRGITLGA